MDKIVNIAIKELKLFFYTPIAYIICFSFYSINGILFWYLINEANTPGRTIDGNILSHITNGAVAWFTILILIPIITMRLVSLETEKKLINHLFSTPVKSSQITLGKFFGGLSFYLILWSPTLLYSIILSQYVTVDYYSLFSGYLGLTLIGGFTIAIGLFCSSIAKNQIISAILTFSFLTMILMFSWFETLISSASILKEVLKYLNFVEHLSPFSDGIINSKDIIFFLTGTFLFLFYTNEIIKLKRCNCD